VELSELTKENENKGRKKGKSVQLKREGERKGRTAMAKNASIYTKEPARRLGEKRRRRAKAGCPSLQEAEGAFEFPSGTYY